MTPSKFLKVSTFSLSLIGLAIAPKASAENPELTVSSPPVGFKVPSVSDLITQEALRGKWQVLYVVTQTDSGIGATIDETYNSPGSELLYEFQEQRKFVQHGLPADPSKTLFEGSWDVLPRKDQTNSQADDYIAIYHPRLDANVGPGVTIYRAVLHGNELYLTRGSADQLTAFKLKRFPS